MQYLLFQNIINYFIIMALQEFRKVRYDFYLQVHCSCNVLILNIYKFFVHIYNSLKKKKEKRKENSSG